MPAFDASTPRLDREVRGQKITIPAIFSEGVTLTGPTVGWANSALASQIVNTIGGDIANWVKEANANLKKGETPKTAADYPDLQAHVDAVFAARVLGVNARKGSGTGSGSNALDRLIATFAAEDAKARIVAKGFKVKDFMAVATQDGKSTKYKDFVAFVTDQKREEFTARAQAILDAQAAEVAAGEDDGGFLSAA